MTTPEELDADRTFRFPTNASGTLRGREVVRVIEFTSDGPVRRERDRVVTEFDPPGTWLIEHSPVDGGGRERVPFEDVTDVNY